MKINQLLDKPTPTIKDLANKYQVSVNVVQQQLRSGIEVEMEHTHDPTVAREIALDHLAERLDYYQLLSHMETPTQESTTRTSAQGAPGTLKAKISGKVTCAKVKALKSRKNTTPHDKAQANWFINMHDCNEQHIQEIFREPSSQVTWRKFPYGMWEANFDYQGHNVVVEMNEYISQDYARFVFYQNDLDMPDHYRGYDIVFRVDKQTDVTGQWGVKSVGLISRVLQVVMSFLENHNWDYVVFSGQHGSRNKLYAAMSEKLAQQFHLKIATSFDDFVVYKPYESLDESFDWKLPKNAWQVLARGDNYITLDFTIGGSDYEIDIMTIPKAPGIYDVVFASMDADDPTGITGSGQPFKVFSAVKQMIDHARSQQTAQPIRGLFFTAKGASRQKLYAALAPKLAQAYGWKYTTDPQKMPYEPNPKFEKGWLIWDPKYLDETAGVGLVVPGVNMPAGMHKNEIQRQAKKFGFRVSPTGVPPLIRAS